MEEKIKTITSCILHTMEPKCNVLFIADEKEKCGGVLIGDATNIAESYFAMLLDENSPIREKLFIIIKLVVLNLIENKTEMGNDLLQNIETFIHNEIYN